MSEPQSFGEYLARFQANTVIDGFGMDVAQHVPCPWCAAADFQVLMPAAGILALDDRPNIDAQMAMDTTCRECGRSGKSLISRGAGSVEFEFVQTDGPDAPEWLTPAPRRLDA